MAGTVDDRSAKLAALRSTPWRRATASWRRPSGCSGSTATPRPPWPTSPRPAGCRRPTSTGSSPPSRPSTTPSASASLPTTRRPWSASPGCRCRPPTGSQRMVIELNRRSMENFIENKKVHEMVMVALGGALGGHPGAYPPRSDLFATHHRGRHRQRRVPPAGHQARGRMRLRGHGAAASSRDAGAVHGRSRKGHAGRDGRFHHQSPEIAGSADSPEEYNFMRLASEKNQISSVNNGKLRLGWSRMPWSCRRRAAAAARARPRSSEEAVRPVKVAVVASRRPRRAR